MNEYVVVFSIRPGRFGAVRCHMMEAFFVRPLKIPPLISGQAKLIEEKRDVTPCVALRQASEQFWEPLSCHLLNVGWPELAHSARGLDVVAACQTRRPAHQADSQADSAQF